MTSRYVVKKWHNEETYFLKEHVFFIFSNENKYFRKINLPAAQCCKMAAKSTTPWALTLQISLKIGNYDLETP